MIAWLQRVVERRKEERNKDWCSSGVHGDECRARWYHCPNCGGRMSEWFTTNGPDTPMRCGCGHVGPARTHAESLRLSRP